MWYSHFASTPVRRERDNVTQPPGITFTTPSCWWFLSVYFFNSCRYVRVFVVYLRVLSTPRCSIIFIKIYNKNISVMKNSKTHSPLLYFIVHSTFHFGSLLRNGIRYPFFFSFEIYLILTVFNIYYIRWWDSADILYSFCVHVCVCVISIHRTSRNTLFKQS